MSESNDEYTKKLLSLYVLIIYQGHNKVLQSPVYKKKSINVLHYISKDQKSLASLIELKLRWC